MLVGMENMCTILLFRRTLFLKQDAHVQYYPYDRHYMHYTFEVHHVEI